MRLTKAVCAGGLSALMVFELSGISAFAQIAPPNVSPPTREEIERGVVAGALGQSAQPLAVDGELERAPCPLAAPEFADITLNLSSVVFRGQDIVSADELAATYSDFIGQTVPVGAICEIRDRAATLLRNKGYLAAVQVPPQKIDGGQVVLDVLIAKMTRAQVRGDAGPSETLLQRYIQKIIDQPAFNINEAERYLLLARDIPGLDVRLALRPTEDGIPGSVIGEFSVVRTPVYADLAVQNLGTRAVGRYGALGRVRVNGLTGMGDETTLSVFSTLDFEEQQVVQGGHSFKIGSEGLTISANGTYAWSDPSLGGGLDLHSETWIAGLEATYPFIRSQRKNLFGTIGFEHIDQDVSFANVPLTRDKLSVAYARLGFNAISPESISGRDGYSVAEPKWSFSASAEIRQGLDILGASEGCGPGLVNCAVTGFVPPSRAEGDPTAFVARLDAVFEYRPDPFWAISFAPRLQYSPEALLSYEEFSGGNYTIGRGFDAGTLIGDSGVGFRSELKYGSLLPKGPDDIAIQPYVFFDAAWVWNEDAAFNGLDPQKLQSAGGGIRATVGRGAQIDALVAVPLNRAGFQTSKGDVRFLVSATFQLAPWNF